MSFPPAPPSERSYEHKLVYTGEVDKYLETGWEPTPNTVPVTRHIGPMVTAQTYVWLRRRVS